MGSVTCPSCGTVNPAGARFCRGCGLSLDATPQPERRPQSNSPNPNAGRNAGPAAEWRAHRRAGRGQPGVPPQGVVAQALAGQIGDAPLAPGATLQSGRYVVERALGAGGMGSVFLARDTHVNNKPVVIKEMSNVYATEEERREAEAEFQAEMATLASLSPPQHPADLRLLHRVEPPLRGAGVRDRTGPAEGHRGGAGPRGSRRRDCLRSRCSPG